MVIDFAAVTFTYVEISDPSPGSRSIHPRANKSTPWPNLPHVKDESWVMQGKYVPDIHRYSMSFLEF